jgi:hypothetical protein
MIEEGIKVEGIDDDLHANRITEIIRVSCEQASLAPERPKETECFLLVQDAA